MIVRSEEKSVLDAGANPAISTKQGYYYTEREWDRSVGWGSVPIERTTGMNSFDRAKSNGADDPTGEERNSSKTK
jgi:hypothetical protein